MRVVINGAGVGGLSLAHQLLHHFEGRVQVKVLEAAPVFKPSLGAGFTLSGGLSCLLKLPKLREPLVKIASVPLRFRQIYDDASHIGAFDADAIAWKPGSDVPQMAQFMRSELHETLVETLPASALMCGQQVKRILADERVVETHRGDRFEYDLLVGADGIKSATRALAFDENWQRKYSGYAIYYCVLPRHKVAEADDFRFESGTISEILGKGNFQMTFECGANKDWTYAYVYRSPTPPEIEEWATTSEHLERSAFEITKYASRAMHFGLYITPPNQVPWVAHDSIVLLGDAAHATVPFLGQGANQAIQDGACLARLFQEKGLDHLGDVLHEYYRIREPPTTRVIQLSERVGQMRTATSFGERAFRHAVYSLMGAFGGSLFKHRFEQEVKPVI